MDRDSELTDKSSSPLPTGEFMTEKKPFTPTEENALAKSKIYKSDFSTETLTENPSMLTSSSRENAKAFSDVCRENSTGIASVSGGHSTDFSDKLGENSKVFSGASAENSTVFSDTSEGNSLDPSGCLSENLSTSGEDSAAFSGLAGENSTLKTFASTSGVLDKPLKGGRKKKLTKNSKDKLFILDNMLPTLEASLNENSEKSKNEDTSIEGTTSKNTHENKFIPSEITANSFTTVPIKDDKNLVTHSSYVEEACGSDSNSEVEPSEEETTVELNFQELVTKPHALTGKKKGSKRPKTNPAVSYKNKEMSSKELEACNIGSDDKPYVCPICQSCFKQAFPLKRHMMIHSAVKPFFCTICDFRCNDGSNLRKHMQTHDDKKYQCPDCDYVCSRPDHLRNHRAKHTGIYKYVCGICGYACNQACDLTRHMIVHGGGKFFTCGQCDYSTNRRSYLKLHMQKHLNAKELTCSICSYQAPTFHTLKKHLLVHTKDKTFQCDDCGQLTTSKSSLLRHRLVHGKKDEEGNPAPKRYHCRNCLFCCHWRSDLVKHLRRKHYFSDVNAIYVEVEAADTQQVSQVTVKQEVVEETQHGMELS